MSQLTNNTTNLQAILDAVNALPEATEPTLQSKTVSPSTSSQTVKPDSGYDGLSQVTVNAMTTATQATPSISVDSAGKITASATQTAGYVAAGTKSATKQLTTQGAQTITPGTADKTIASGRYLTGTQTIKGDANLVAGNIKSGVSIFGVAGSYEGSGGSGGASVETCTVVFAYFDRTVVGISYMTLDDSGKPSARHMTNSSSSFTLTDVVCNSVMTLSYDYQYASVALTNGTVLSQMVGFYSAVSIDAQAGGTVTVAYTTGGGGGAD